jgi:ADP-heptose:LPS heptosyltransferase
MGLGGHLTWTAAIREISQRGPKNVKVLPCRGQGKTVTSLVTSSVFENNPNIHRDKDLSEAFLLFMNNPETSYCERDTSSKAYHRGDKHIIETVCSFYGIDAPDLRCEMFFSKAETAMATDLVEGLDDTFITIEPYSKTNYTVNREYPLKKWQKVVDSLSREVQIVQIGLETSPLLDSVIDFRGKTSFREAALLIGESELFLSAEGGLVHAATAVNTPSVVIITGYQTERMVAYPQNININIAGHGPCGLKVPCDECKKDAENHDEQEIVDKIEKFLL